MKKTGCWAAIVLVVGLIALACYGCVQFTHKFTLSMASPHLFSSTSTNPKYQAHFLISGFRTRDIAFFASSTIESPECLKLIAHLEWNYVDFSGAVWSRDGSVIACRAIVMTKENLAELEKQKLDKDAPYKPIPQILPYTSAYDFREEKAIVMERGRYNTRSEWETHSKIIEELLESRGGAGKKITRQEIEKESKKLDWSEWQPYVTAESRKPM